MRAVPDFVRGAEGAAACGGGQDRFFGGGAETRIPAGVYAPGTGGLYLSLIHILRLQLPENREK